MSKQGKRAAFAHRAKMLRTGGNVPGWTWYSYGGQTCAPRLTKSKRKALKKMGPPELVPMVESLREDINAIRAAGSVRAFLGLEEEP